jgi:hypothetical protein
MILSGCHIPTPEPKDMRPQRLILGLTQQAHTDCLSAQSCQSALQRWSELIQGEMIWIQAGALQTIVVEARSALLQDEMIEKLASDPHIRYAEPDARMQIR